MSRAKRFFSTIFMGLILCVCVLFGACAKDKAEVAGTYKFSKMIYVENGMEIEINAGEQFMGMMTLTEDFMTITLNEDGTAEMKMVEDGATEQTSGTWEKSGDNSVVITLEGDAQTCQWNGNTLTLDDGEGTTLILKK